MRRLIQRGQLFGQRPVVHHRPVAQFIEQSPLHLGCGGLGVGDAKDGFRRGVPQQKTRDPLDQGRRLARPRVGRDEHRGLRIGGANLRIENGRVHSAAALGLALADHMPFPDAGEVIEVAGILVDELRRGPGEPVGFGGIVERGDPTAQALQRPFGQVGAFGPRPAYVFASGNAAAADPHIDQATSSVRPIFAKPPWRRMAGRQGQLG